MTKPGLTTKKLSPLQEISEAIVFTDDLHSIANLVLDLSMHYTDAEACSLMALNERNELSILASRGITPKCVKRYQGKVGKGIAGTVAGNRAAILVDNIEDNSFFKGKQRGRYRTRSFISCPIVNKDKLFGILNINDKKNGQAFSSHEFDLIKIIANQAAMAFESAFLMGQLKRKAVELEELNKKLIETDVFKTKFLTRVSHELRTPLNAIRGAIFYLQRTPRVSSNDRNDFQNIISSETERLTAIVEDVLSFLRTEDATKLIKKSAICVADIFKDLQESLSLRAILGPKDIGLRTSIPGSMFEIVGDKIKVVQLFINLFDGLSHYLERGDIVELSAHESDFIEVQIMLPRRLPRNILPYLADAKHIFQADHSEDRLKLYLARNIVELHRWQLHANNSSKACTLTITIPKKVTENIEACVNMAMDAFVDFIAELFDIDICSIMLNDEISDELTVKSALGLDDDIIKQTRIKLGDRIAGWVALEGKPLFIENIENEARFAKRSIPQYTTKSLMSLPLKLDGRVIGVLNLNNKKESQPFTEHDFQIATELTEKVSHFIKLIYTGQYHEDDFRRLLTSFLKFNAFKPPRSDKG